MSKRQRSKRLGNRQPAREVMMGSISLKWAWWKVLYFGIGFTLVPSVLVGFALGHFWTSFVFAMSVLVIRRLIFWFDIFRVEPDVPRRMIEVIRLDRFIAVNLLSAKQTVICLLVTCILIFLRPEGSGFLAVIVVSPFILLMLVSEFAPPFVLFLGSSDRSRRLFLRVMAGCVPHRAITLLRQSNWAIDKWCARTTDTSHWREVVERLSRVACVVVLDARFVTDSVNEECDWLLTQGMNYKLIVVGDSMGNCPVLDAALFRLPSSVINRLLIATPDTVQGAVNMLARTKRHLPSVKQPVWLLLQKL